MPSRFETELKKLEHLLDGLNTKRQRGGNYGVVPASNANPIEQGVANMGAMANPSSRMAGGKKRRSRSGSKKCRSRSGSKQRGGDMEGGRSKDERDYRSFKVIKLNGNTMKHGPKGKLYLETKKGKKKDKVSITEVAQKLFNQLCREHLKTKDRSSCKANFTIVETTRDTGVNRKELHYRGEVVKKKKPVVLKDKKTGKTRTLKYDALVHRVKK